MNIVFDIIENLIDPSILCTITLNKHNITISRDEQNIDVFYNNIENNHVYKYSGLVNAKKYKLFKEYILQQTDDFEMIYISGISSSDNLLFLKQFFLISDISDVIGILSFNKLFK